MGCCCLKIRVPSTVIGLQWLLIVRRLYYAHRNMLRLLSSRYNIQYLSLITDLNIPSLRWIFFWKKYNQEKHLKRNIFLSRKIFFLYNIYSTWNKTPKNEGIGTTQTNSENINPQLSKAKKLERCKDYQPIRGGSSDLRWTPQNRSSHNVNQWP